MEKLIASFAMMVEIRPSGPFREEAEQAGKRAGEVYILLMEGKESTDYKKGFKISFFWSVIVIYCCLKLALLPNSFYDLIVYLEFSCSML